MPLDAIDKQPIDITGDGKATQPLNPKQMAGAQKQQVNRTRLGPQPAGKGLTPGQAGGKPEQKAETDQGEPESKAGGEGAVATPSLHPDKGLQVLHDGIGQILQDPEWMQHPLLRLFADPTGDPNQMGQDLWSATQWWGNVVGAAFDPNAIHAAAASIEHDNSVGGKIAQGLFMIHDDPAHEFAWNAIPYALSWGAEWEPWLWGPAVAAQGPQQLNQLPQAVMGLVGNDLKHPQFQDPDWYARMGSYVIAGLMLRGHAGKGVGPLLKFSGRLKIFDGLAEHADRIWGGQGGKTPIQGPDGQVYDPDKDPTGHAFATWYRDNIAPVAEKETAIGKAALKPITDLISHPEIEGAYQEVARDPSAKSDFARALGMAPTAAAGAVRHQFFAMVENRELTPAMSARVVKEWDRFGPVIGQMGKIKYWHGGEAPYRNVLDSLQQISDPKLQKQATQVMAAANGLRADLWRGIHGYGNDLSEALVKGVLGHGRSAGHYQTRLVAGLRKVLPTAAARERVTQAIEAANLSPEEGQAAYEALAEHERWALDLVRRLIGELRTAKQQHGLELEAQPNFVYRVPKARPDLEAVFKGLPQGAKEAARVARARTPFGYVSRQHRAFQLVASPQGEIRAEAAYPTTASANLARAAWRAQIKEDLRLRAVAEPALKAIVNDEAKLEALAQAEIPDFSSDILDSLSGSGNRGLFPDLRALFTHQVMQSAQRTLVKHDKDGRWHPLTVARSESGQESSATLSEHFKELHGADTTTDFYRAQGWKPISGFGSGHIFHPSFADPLNTALDFGKGDADASMRYLKKISATGKHMIMLNPLWHSGNMMGRFLMLAGAHPVGVARAMMKARGMRELNPEQAREWWQAQEHEAIEHGLLPPQLNEDVVNTAGKYHGLASGDIETGTPMDVKQPVSGISHSAADALNAVKGVDAWWQSHVNNLMWSKIHDFGILSYLALKDDAIHRGMAPGDARLYAASQANSFAGMVSPDRWMYSPAMHSLSQTLLFAPNWWRTFPRILLGSYDRMGMKTNPALTHAWALNGAKTIGAMLLLKGATDNLLNYALSGHWQFQNPDGYKNSVTMDRFFAPDSATGAHHVMEDPLWRQANDLEKVLGLYEPMQHGDWHPDFQSAGQGAMEVAEARSSPLVQALETATNWDLYNTIRHRAMRWVDPSHPGFFQSAEAVAAGAASFIPFGPAYTAQAGLQGAQAAPGTLDWGPFKGTQIPGWAMRAFDPNDPLVQVLSWLGIRGGYPAPVSSDARGLSSDELTQLHKYANDWNTYSQKQQQAVMSGGLTWNEWAYNYKRQSAAYANQVQGLTGGTSQYMQGADGLLARYEAVYNDPKAFDANGDINWAYVQRQQDQMQAQTDPATWRQMVALKDKREMQYPVLRVYKDTLQNYKNFQDTWAKQQGLDGETLRNQVAEGASAPSFQEYEATHPELARWYNAKRQWELSTKAGFAYGLFTDNQYVMRLVAPHGTKQEAAAAEQKILPQIESEEAAGKFVTPTGE